MRIVLAIAGIAVAVFTGLAVWEVSRDESSGPELAPPPETADPLGALPRGWTKTANPEGGFALGVPPGWSTKNAGAKTTLKAPGSTVVVSITADRSDEAIKSGLNDFAEAIGADLGSEAPEPVAEPPAAGGPGYEAAAVTVRAAPGKGGRTQRLQVIVVRRPELATFPILVGSDQGVKRAELDPIVAKIVLSLRGHPVAAAGP